MSKIKLLLRLSKIHFIPLRSKMTPLILIREITTKLYSLKVCFPKETSKLSQIQVDTAIGKLTLNLAESEMEINHPLLI